MSKNYLVQAGEKVEKMATGEVTPMINKGRMKELEEDIAKIEQELITLRNENPESRRIDTLVRRKNRKRKELRRLRT